MGWDALGHAEMLEAEFVERREAGNDVAGVEDEVRAALAAGVPEEIERASTHLQETSLRPDWPYEEPSTLDEIRRAQPRAPDRRDSPGAPRT